MDGRGAGVPFLKSYWADDGYWERESVSFRDVGPQRLPCSRRWSHIHVHASSTKKLCGIKLTITLKREYIKSGRKGTGKLDNIQTHACMCTNIKHLIQIKFY